MDIQLVRTFLEIVASGSFLNAAERLHITQSAVSLRVKRLEEELGRNLFIRTKRGVALSPAGVRFERHARTISKVWEDARYDVALPSGYTDMLSVGCQYSLWPKFGGRWLRLLEDTEPDVAFRVEAGRADHLMNLLIQGNVDIALMYSPQVRPGLAVDRLMDETLILVSTDPDYGTDLDDRYVFIDWGTEFATAHAFQYPSFQSARTTLGIGPLALNFVLERERAAYFPARVVRPFIDDGKLHVVSQAPVFPFSAFVVWQASDATSLSERVLESLKHCVEQIEREQNVVLEEWSVDLTAQLVEYA